MTTAHTWLMAHAGIVRWVVVALAALAVAVLVEAVTRPLLTWGDEE